MAPKFDDDVADLHGNAMADDVAPDDVCEPAALVPLVGLVLDEAGHLRRRPHRAGTARLALVYNLHDGDALLPVLWRLHWGGSIYGSH